MAEIRFFADQHYPGAVTAGLARRGIDVLTALDAGRCGASDAEQLAFAATEGRVMLTFDPDFLDLHRSGTQYAGIAWCPATKYGVGPLIQLLILLHAIVAADEMVDHIEYL